jgi:hypothetical protein
LPALELGDLAERRHAAVGITVGDFPEEGAVGLGLDFSDGEIGGFLEACACGAVAFRAVPLEELGTASGGVLVFGQGILTGGGLARSVPSWVLFIVRVLREGRQAEKYRGRQKQVPQS